MRLAYFPGCKINFEARAYGEAAQSLMAFLGVTLVPLPFNCCGNPARGKNLSASVFAAVRNITMAQAAGLDIFTPCKCCFGQLKQGIHWYKTDPRIKEEVDTALAEDGLVFAGQGVVQDGGTGKLVRRQVAVRHLLDFIYHDIGVETLTAMVRHPLVTESAVLQQGCHALRPFSVTRFDNPFEPVIFRALAACTGLEVRDWAKETECCGDPVAETNMALALKILSEKFTHAKKARADFICTACTHCQIQYERHTPGKDGPRAVPFTVLLARALGVKA